MRTRLSFHRRTFHFTCQRTFSFDRTPSDDTLGLSQSPNINTVSDGVRRNKVQIQLLPQEIHKQLFGHCRSTGPTALQQQICETHLKAQGIWGKPTTTQPLVEGLKLPPLIKPTLDQHFQHLSQNAYLTTFKRAQNLCRLQLTPLPSAYGQSWLKRAGWTRYMQGSVPRSVKVPLEDALVFDVEVLMSIGPYPLLAICASDKAWYAWISPGLIGTELASESDIEKWKSDKRFNFLIPFGSECQRLIVGHHVSYDRARILEEYRLQPSSLQYLDTMSLHIAVAGLTINQRARWKKIQKEMDEGFPVNEDETLWYQQSGLNSLQSVAKLYCDQELDKSSRDYFVDGRLQDIHENFQSLVDYCANDVKVTHDVFKVVFPKFWAKKIQGNFVSFGGILEMAKTILPISNRWPTFIQNCENISRKSQEEVHAQLRVLADEYLQTPQDKRETDHYLRQLDWTVSKRGTLPKWYRQLIPSRQKEPKITIRSKVTPLLLRMTWFDYPIYYLGRYAGWCYRVPLSETSAQGNKVPLNVDEVCKAISEHRAKCKTSKSSDAVYEEILREDVGEALFYRLPSLSGKDCENCGSPLAKAFAQYFSEGKLDSSHPVAKTALQTNAMSSYWTSSRDRIMNQFIVWPHDLANAHEGFGEPKGSSGWQTTDKSFGILLPLLVTMGTITRRAVESTWLTASNAKKNRIGSELKSNVIAPEGYALVGADVDSQELWIAGLLGDRQLGIHGGTAFGWMTLQGQKKDGTDLHSTSAQILGASRDHAKIFNYARIYGSGVKFSAQLLARCNPNLSTEEANQRAVELYARTKGMHYYPSKKNMHSSGIPSFMKQSFWYGGTESYMFNSLEEIARADDPRTPVLHCQLPDSLLSKSIRELYSTSCVNWVVQSSGVDYLHLILTSMRYLIDTYKIQARLLITIHDEIRYLVKGEDSARAALALQISNIWTRAFFAQQCGMTDLPWSVAFFSAVDIDKILRKEVTDPCITPSQPSGLPTDGKSLSIYDIVKLTGPELKDNKGDVPVEAHAQQSPISPGTASRKPTVDEKWLRAQICNSKSQVLRFV